VVFRGWSRVYGFFLWAKETRSSAYVCRECAETLTTINLTVTALLGWWALQSFFWYAPRATYFNWRAVWAPPGDPLAWNAHRLDRLLTAIRDSQQGPKREREREPEPEEQEDEFAGSPLADLTAAELELVGSAPNPYAQLQINSGATDTQIKAAWRKQAKANHPDLNPGDANAKARMTAVNQAYELLRNPRLRAAYDWLATTKSRPR
jgi:DnaJ-domain-containing protein 1